MQLNPVVSALLRSVWMIEPEHARNLYLLAEKYLEGSYVGEEDKIPITASAIDSAGRTVSLDEAKGEGLIAVIPVLGPIMKEDWCGDPGTATMGKWVKQANENPAIDAIILQIDSPGGSVDGTKTFADIIASSKKPVITFIDGLCASAGYWIGSAGDEIISSSETDLIGSIGTMTTLYDFRGRYKQMGIEQHDIYATASNDKNQDYHQALDKNYEPIQKEILDPLNDQFVGAIKNNRGSKLNSSEKSGVLSGKLFTAQLALTNGLIDSIGTFDTAVQRAHELANATRNISASESQETSFPMKKIKAVWNNIMSSLSAKENDELTDEHLDKMNAELGTLAAVKAERDELKTKLETVNTTVADLTSKLTKMEAKAEVWEKLAKEYGAKDGADAGKETGATSDPPTPKAAADAKVITEPFDAELAKYGL